MRSKITLLLLAAVALLSAMASMATPSYAETGLWGFESETPAGARVERGLSRTGIEGYRLAYDEDAVGYPLIPGGGTKSLGDDIGNALDEIAGGKPRPNVRKSKPFTNDGRGGTSKLPGSDSAGSPIGYTEHTVNPRPPGGTLDGRRIVTGSDGSAWATTDHFRTWTQIR